uniref:Uncharacterized protein n=1 Tax=Oryza barthii TaxID=65489 RepID=A0A0D3HME6_9ORYZ
MAVGWGRRWQSCRGAESSLAMAVFVWRGEHSTAGWLPLLQLLEERERKRFININLNVENTRMTYIVKRRKY